MPERSIRRTKLAGLVALAACALAPASAAAVEATTPPTAPAAAPVAGSMRLALQRVHGHAAPAVVGERFVVRGVVTPYVAGQKIQLSIYRDGRRVLSRRLGLSPLGNGAGQFHFAYKPPHSGLVQVRAEHLATAQLAAFKAKSVSVRFEPSELSFGAGGNAVWILQRELAALHYQLNVNGRYDEATGRAVLAFRKVTGQARIETANSRIFGLLQEGAGRFHVRYRHDGSHIEADLSKQVLAEIEPGGRVRRIITISSGKPSTPTVIGRFRVYRREPGTNSHGMVDSSYFISGYAIHGYAEVPPYAASHGCLRIPIPDAAAVYSWVQIGFPVDVYTDNGGGSHTVRGNAGP
ncbi:MAG TPA: L,D-transpeptidase [Solirubrobacteraceae bacterium]|nr:L,D-transpeptidase [Solirubrobacteraceae bacterium]